MYVYMHAYLRACMHAYASIPGERYTCIMIYLQLEEQSSTVQNRICLEGSYVYEVYGDFTLLTSAYDGGWPVLSLAVSTSTDSVQSVYPLLRNWLGGLFLSEWWTHGRRPLGAVSPKIWGGGTAHASVPPNILRSSVCRMHAKARTE